MTNLLIFVLIVWIVSLWVDWLSNKKTVKCEPQLALEDGFCNWVCPTSTGYLMQCCDCELIHEVDFRVVKYKSNDSDEFDVIEDKNTQVQFRMRRYE